MTAASMKTSLVIPTWNGEDELGKTLTAVRAAHGGESLEILCIDSNSTDGTRDVAASFGARVGTIPPGRFNHGGTRNLGIQLASGDVVILMTQDATPAHVDWLERLLAPFDDSRVAGVYARQVAPDGAPGRAQAEQAHVDGKNETADGRSIHHPEDWFRLRPMERYRLVRFDNVCSAIRRTVWERIPLAVTPYGEDLDWGMRVMLAGYRIVYEPCCRVLHAHERPASYVYKRTVVDHHLLADRFRLLTVPAWWYLPRSLAGGVVWELRNVWRTGKGIGRVSNLLTAAGLGVASCLGQYAGGRRWRTGQPREARKGV